MERAIAASLAAAPELATEAELPELQQ